ncbi:hypothetical protein [Shinella zoogloeoides]|uniref:hypothetical protein n=1 Tax=Shinella zoogloeoides TaxID=352475 RepID=UPI0028AD2EED|nr:hypothetical protein [Shinella zoogloeoides]
MQNPNKSEDHHGRARRGRIGMIWLWFVGTSAAITMAAPTTVSVAAISIIGIPIAFFLAIAPLLFLVSLGAWIASRWLGGSMYGLATGVAVTLALLAIPPFLVNRSLETRVRSYVASDHDDGTKPVGGTIAVRSSTGTGASRRDVLNCDGFCQRALMNAVAKRVLVAYQDINLAIDPAVEVDSFRMERRATCPQVELQRGMDPIVIESERKNRRGKYADELMQLEIAKGNCLIAEKMPLGIADTVLSVGVVHRGKRTAAAGLDPYADTISADRITVHEKRGSTYSETFRQTYVVTEKLMPLYAPTVAPLSDLDMVAALARYRETINIASRYYEHPDWSGFLINHMGYDLTLRRNDANSETRKVLSDALNTQDIDESVAKVGSDFLEGFERNHKIEGEDLDVAKQLLVNVHFPVPMGASAAVRYAKDAPQDYFDTIGASMFERLRMIASSDDGKRYPAWRGEASNISGVIHALPRATILKHRADLEWLAKQDRVRTRVYTALQRLSEFGATGAPTLLWLIDDAQRFRDKSGDDWQSPYLAGLTGLCHLREDGASMIQPIYDRLISGTIVASGSYGRLVISTLAGMGADPDDVWQHVKATETETSANPEDARRRFDQEVSRAQKTVDCTY